MPPQTEIFLRSHGHAMAVDKARNKFVREFQEQEKRHPDDRLWMVDDDMIWHRDSVGRLCERNLDIVAALTWTNQVPPRPTIWEDERWKDGIAYYFPSLGETLRWIDDHNLKTNDPVVLPLSDDALVEVKATGAAFMLVKRRVFDAIEPPWFEGTEDGFGEDFAFCRKARAAGFKVYVDRSVIVTHMPTFALGPATFRAFALIAREMSEEEKERAGFPNKD